MGDENLRWEIDALYNQLETIEDTLDALTADREYVLAKIERLEECIC